MLSKDDLIYLGTCLLLGNGRNPIVDSYEQDRALEVAKKLFNKVYEDDNMVMINE